ncbi:hypothetical protein D3C87_2026350 [compost metagenome]
MLPPLAASKMAPPKTRSNISKTRATVIAGKARTIKPEVTKADHVNIGKRMYVRPGARMLIIVTRKLIPPISVPIPAICKPST